jgi:hypothetical protein
MEAERLVLLAWVPSEATLARVTAPVCRSWTKTSNAPFVSPRTRLLATDSNATKRPSALIAGDSLPPSAWVPSEATLTRVVVPLCRSWTKMSEQAKGQGLVSPGTRLEAVDQKAMKRPSPLIAGVRLWLLASVPSEATLTRVVVPLCRSWTKMSSIPLVSPRTRLEAKDSNATKRPSTLSWGAPTNALSAFASVPSLATLTRVVLFVTRSCTKTSATPLVSPEARLLAPETNATSRPSPLTEAEPLSPFACAPPLATLTRVVLGFFVPRSLTKTSAAPLVSPETRLEAEDEKATTLPPALTPISTQLV